MIAPIHPLPSPLTFEADTHTYRWRGDVVPSVTQILRDLQLSPQYPEDRGWLEFGRAVHKCCDLVLQDRLDSCGDLLLPYVNAFRDVVALYKIKPLNTELEVYHDTLGFAGRLDIHCRIFGIYEAIIDYKTGLPPSCTGLQTAGYDLALSRMLKTPTIKRRRYALRLLTDETKTTGKAKLVEYTDPFNYEVFSGAVAVWKWKFGKNGNGKGGVTP